MSGQGVDGAVTGANGSRSTPEVEVAHEALITNWTALRSWLDTNRTALGFRQELGDAAATWIKNGKDDTFLVHEDAQLDNAEALVRSRVLEFNRREQAYFDACIDLRARRAATAEADRQRARSRNRALMTAMAILLVVALVTSGVAGWLAFHQQRQARINLAQALAAQAMIEYGNGHDEVAALLARQAYLFDEDKGAEALVSDSVQLAAGSPFFSTVTGNQQSWISGLAFSPDGRQLASSSADGTVALLNIEQPNDPQDSLTEHTAWVPSVAYHPGTKRNLMASGGGDGMAILRDAASGAPIGQPIPGPGGVVFSVAFDGGTRLAAGSCVTEGGAAPTGESTAKNCATNGAVVRIWAIDDTVRASGAPGSMWQAPTFEERTVAARRICAVTFSPDGRWLAAGGCERTPEEAVQCAAGSDPLVLWDMTKPPDTPAICLNGYQGGIWALAFSPDGKTLASGGSDASVRLWDITSITAETTSLRPDTTLSGHDETVHSLAFSDDGQLLATGSHDGTVGMWYLAGGNPTLFRLGSTTEWVRAVAFGGPSGRLLAAASAGGKIRLWDLQDSGAAPSVLRGHTSYVRSLAFKPGPPGEILPPLVSGSEDGTVRLWEFGDGVTSTILTMEPADPASTPAAAPAASPGATPIATPAATPIASPVAPPAASSTPSPAASPAPATAVSPALTPVNVTSVSYSHDGGMLAAASEDGSVRVWDQVAPSIAPRIIADHAWGTTTVAFSPVGDYLATVGSSGDIFLWDPHKERAADSLWPSLCLSDPPSGESGGCGTRKDKPAVLAFNADGTMLAAGDSTGTVRVWDMGDGPAAPEEIVTFVAEQPVTVLAFVPHNGDLLAIGGIDGITRIWSFAEGGIVARLPGHTDDVRSLAFTADGTQLVTGSNDQTVLIWNTAEWDDTPKEIRNLAEWIRAVAISPDDHTLAAVSTQGTIRLVSLQTEDLVEHVCQRVTHNLSHDEWDQFVGEDDLTSFDWLFQEDLDDYQATCADLPPGRDIPTDPPAPAGTEAAAWRQPPVRQSGVGRPLGHRRRARRRLRTGYLFGSDIVRSRVRGSRRTGPGVRSAGTR